MRLAFGKQVLLAAVITVVCGGCDKGPDYVPVHGEVRYKGKPLEYGSVMFQPPGTAAMARSEIDSKGTFRLVSDGGQEGVVPGPSLVRVTAFELQRAAAAGQRHDEEPTLGKSAIPKKYQSFGTSGIEIDVQPGMDLPLVIELD